MEFHVFFVVFFVCEFVCSFVRLFDLQDNFSSCFYYYVVCRAWQSPNLLELLHSCWATYLAIQKTLPVTSRKERQEDRFQSTHRIRLTGPSSPVCHERGKHRSGIKEGKKDSN